MIAGFFGEYRFLSNFYPCKVEFAGIEWNNVECAYQWAKTMDPDLLAEFHAASPGQAKRLGSKLVLPEEWRYRKVCVMTDLVEQKFMRNTELRELLIATKNQRIVELNTWGDTFWGMCRNSGGDLVGTNRLGDIIELTRMKLVGEGLCL